MAFPIIPKRRSGATGNPTSLNLGELAVNTQTGELFLGADGGVTLLNGPVAAGTTVTEHTANGTSTAFTFTGYNGTADAGYIVSVGGIDQPPSTYSISNTAGGTITFVEAPVAGELISIRALVAGSGGGGSGDATSLQGTAISTSTPSTGNLLRFDGTNWAPFDGTCIQNWSETTGYGIGDLVFNGGNIWKCEVANIGAEPINPQFTGAFLWSAVTGSVLGGDPLPTKAQVGWMQISCNIGTAYIPVYQ
jgi:hypothetical protein